MRDPEESDVIVRLRKIQYKVSWQTWSLMRQTIYAAIAEIEELRGSRDDGSRYIDWDRRLLVCNGQRLKVEEQELKLLRRLCDTPGEVVTRSDLVTAIWSDLDSEPATADRIIYVYVNRLRKYCPWPIRTIWRTGFLIEGYTKPKPALPELPPTTGISRERLMAGR
jgi:DNA-binding response OmpR family regulator